MIALLRLDPSVEINIILIPSEIRKYSLMVFFTSMLQLQKLDQKLSGLKDLMRQLHCA